MTTIMDMDIDMATVTSPSAATLFGIDAFTGAALPVRPSTSARAMGAFARVRLAPLASPRYLPCEARVPVRGVALPLALAAA